MNHPTMPDPFSSHALGVSEIPIREVISRLASIVGGQLAEYVREAHTGVVLVDAVQDVEAALDHLLTLWDDRARLATPEQVDETMARVLAARTPVEPDRVPDLMDALEKSVAAAKEARKNHPRKLTPDQIEAGERHARLQAEGGS